jgi:hypothetical protein
MRPGGGPFQQHACVLSHVAYRYSWEDANYFAVRVAGHDRLDLARSADPIFLKKLHIMILEIKL